MYLGADMRNFSFIKNLIPFSFLLKFRICKVGGMHSYECGEEGLGGVGAAFGLVMTWTNE